MKVLRYIAKFAALCLILIVTFEAYDYYKNHQAYDVKRKIIEKVNLAFKEQKSIELENIGGINWEKICFISYELNGAELTQAMIYEGYKPNFANVPFFKE